LSDRLVLLTGFEPFGGDCDNPSWDAVAPLNGELVPGHYIVARRLPCVFGHALDELAGHVAALSPRLLIAVGYAAARTQIAVERVAINIDDARAPDNAGNRPIDTPVITGGPAAYFSTIPIKAIVRAIRAAGIEASVSQSAGTYVCNHVFYAACHIAAGLPYTMPTGFLHVPRWPPAVLTDAIRIAVSTALTTRADIAETGGAIS
jgi:pyroglutamyl-peptidase